MGVETTWTAALAAAFSDRAAQATELAAAYKRDQTPSQDVINALAPMLSAAVAIANKDGQSALTALTAAAPFERYVGPALPYLRGLAYELLQDHQHAITEFRSVVDHPGNHPTDLVHSVARLSLARALAASGATADARLAYDNFTKVWRGADAQQPLLVAATREAAALR
jgi:hypothetical protein